MPSYEATQKWYLEALEWWDRLTPIEKIGTQKIIKDIQSQTGEGPFFSSKDECLKCKGKKSVPAGSMMQCPDCKGTGLRAKDEE